jgi:hypothetical protein
VGIARENGYAGGLVEADPDHGESSGGHHGLSETNLHAVGVAIALELKISEAAVELYFRIAIGVCACPAQQRQRERALGRNPGHAAVLKLDFRAPVIPGIDGGSFKERRIGHRLVGQRLVALGKMHFPLDVAEPDCARRLRSIGVLRSQTGTNRQCRQNQRRNTQDSLPNQSLVHLFHGVTTLTLRKTPTTDKMSKHTKKSRLAPTP